MPHANRPQPGLTDSWGRRNRKLSDINCAQCGATFRPRANVDKCCSDQCKALWWEAYKFTRAVRRFWARVIKTEGCWEWQGRKDKKGYGYCRAFDRTLWRTHRLSWFIHHGPIPEGQWVLHKCDNPSCVRPDHLFLGDHDANTEDKISKSRQARGEMCKKKLIAAQVLEIRKLRGEGHSLRVVAKKFNVTYVNIAAITKRLTWKHL